MELRLNSQEVRQLKELKNIMENCKNYKNSGKHLNKRFKLVGKILEIKEPIEIKFKCAVELEMPEEIRLTTQVNIQHLDIDKNLVGFIQLTELKLEIIEVNQKYIIQLIDTEQTICLPLIPISNKKIIKKSELLLSTPKSRKRSFYSLDPHELQNPLWPLLTINLRHYARNTELGLRFEVQSLLSIEESISFYGIISAIEQKNDLKGTSFKFNIRDMLTNDSIDTYVFSGSKSVKDLEYLKTVGIYDVVHVIGKRKISQYLNIYCKLMLNKDYSNFSIESKHVDCFDSLCPCKLGDSNEYTPNFAPFTLIFQIKPVMLFRLIIKLQLRVCYLNYLLFNYKCSNCKSIWLMKENLCCQNQKLKTNVTAKIIAEDSSGVADCDVPTLKNVSLFLNLEKSFLQNLGQIKNNSHETMIKYKEFPEKLKNHLKLLGPVFKYCLTKVTPKIQNSKTDSSSLVHLNTSNANTDISIRILKIYN